MEKYSEKDIKDHAREVAEVANPQSMIKELDRAEHDLKHQKKQVKKKTPMELKKEEDKRLVEGRFRNIESPGSPLTFSFNMDRYTFEDGSIQKIPLEVARHLNNCYYKIHENAISATDDGFKTSSKIGRKIDRFAFESLVFTPEDKFGAKKRLVEVEY